MKSHGAFSLLQGAAPVGFTGRKGPGDFGSIFPTEWSTLHAVFEQLDGDRVLRIEKQSLPRQGQTGS